MSQDGTSPSGDGTSDGTSGGGSSGGGVTKSDTPPGPVAVVNLSYSNDPDYSVVTFVLKNDALTRLGQVRSLKVSFGGTQVASWEEPRCLEWMDLQAGRKSDIVSITIQHLDTPDPNGTASLTCSPTSEDRPRVAPRPNATRGAIGMGPVTVVVSGILADATPFVAKADGPASP